MSQTWMEDLESEDYESNGEADYEGESNGEADYEEFGEDARSDARRARQQRIMLERRRREAELRRRRRPPSLPQRPLPRGAQPPRAARVAGPSPRQTVRAIRDLDLETKVELDSLRRRLKESNRRASRGTWATVAGVAAAEIINQFDALENHPDMSAAIIGAPLLLLSPEKQRSGIEGFLLDPRVIGGAAVVGIVVASRWRNATQGISRIEFVGEGKVKAGNPGSVTGLAFDHNNNYLSNATVTYTAAPPGILNLNASDGTYTTTAGKTGEVVVIARSGGASNTTSVMVHA